MLVRLGGHWQDIQISVAVNPGDNRCWRPKAAGPGCKRPVERYRKRSSTTTIVDIQCLRESSYRLT